MRTLPDFLSIGEIAAAMMKTAHRLPMNNGEQSARTAHLIASCTRISRNRGVTLCFTHDTGHHSCGWWKNPDYERCHHLSLSFFDPETRERATKDARKTEEWLVAFFGNARRMAWAEPPFSAKGKALDVWHYRLFFSEGWIAPILPRGEVYSKEFTELGWLSYSELQAGIIAGDAAALAQKGAA